MGTMNPKEPAGRKLRNFMGVAAALCVLGLASFVWLHNAPGVALTGVAAAGVVSDTPAPGTASAAMPAATGVPSAESVFHGAGYIAPEEPIAQF